MIIQILTKIAFHLRTLKMNLFENSYNIVKIFPFIKAQCFGQLRLYVLQLTEIFERTSKKQEAARGCVLNLTGVTSQNNL